MLEPLPKELQAAAIAHALESSSPTSRPSISILGYGVTTKPIVAFLNALGKACAIYDDKPEGKGVEMKNVDSSSGGDVENILLDSREFCPESSALEILSPGIPPDHRYFGGARRAVSEYDFIWWLENSASGSQGRVGFWAKNGDSKETSANAERYPLFCCGEPAVTHAQVRAFDSPCKAPFLAQKSCREQTELESKVDSRETAQNVENSASQKPTPQKTPSDSKILELESGLFEPRKEIRLGGLSTQCGDEIHDSSPKAESPQIWISGTNGKTTTTQMLESILSPFGARAGGNIGTPLITLYEQNAPLWILETSSFALHYTRTATPSIYALLPLSPDHISWHNGFENYVCDKLSPLARMGAHSVAILPSALRDHRLCQGFLGEAIFYTDSSDLRAYLLDNGLGDALKQNALDSLPFFEPFLLDAYIALCCAFALSRKCPHITTATFLPTLAGFKIGEHRVEEFYVRAFGESWLFVDDSKGTNTDATLQAITRYKDRALFLILGGDDKGADCSEIFTLLAGLKRVEIFTIGSNEPKLLDLAARHSVKAHKCGTLDCAMEKIWAMIAESMDSKETSAIAERYPLFSKEATLCHATANALARNDNKTATSQKVDSSNAQNLSEPQAQANLDSSKSLSDSKILDEKCGLQGKSQGSYLSGNDRRDFSPLPHFSLKAESPQAQKPTPKPSKAESTSQNFVCLLSPAAASLDQFSSYKERGERFKSLARSLAPSTTIKDSNEL